MLGHLIKVAPAPSFSGGTGRPSLATIYMSHYQRIMAVVDAARTGNRQLIALAVENHDKHGSKDVTDE